MKIIPNDARIELYGLQVICDGCGLSYVDHVWKKREEENPRDAKSTGAWPFRKSLGNNVTPIRGKRGER